MNRKILQLAIPNIISNISIPLLGIVDMALMGHMESDAYIGAIAVGSLIFNFIYWSLGFLRMGTSGFTAQAVGRQDRKETILVFSRAAMIGLGIGLLLLLLQKPIEALGFWAIRGEARVESLAIEYFRIRIWAAPAVLGQFALLGFFLGMQNARLPMIVLVLTNAINLAFNYYFVMVLDLGSSGVAAGTVIAQYSGLLIAIYLLRRHFRDLFPLWTIGAMMQADKFRHFMVINRDIFIRTMSLVVVFTFFTARSASSDLVAGKQETILAVNSLLMQFFMFFSFLIDGFAHAAEALTGKYIGARDRNALKQSVRLLFIWGTAIAALFTLLYLFGGRTILGLLTNNTEIISNAGPYLFWIALIPMLSYAAFLWDGIFVGATAGPQMRNSMLIASGLFFPVFFLAGKFMGNHGLWLAFVVFMAARGISMQLMARKAVYTRVNSTALHRS